VFSLTNLDVHINTSAGLTHLAELYNFADIYLVKGLAIISHEAIKFILHTTDPSETNIADIIRLLEYAYEGNTEEFESNGEAGSLSATIKDYAADNIITLNGIKDFMQFLEKGGKVVADVVDAVVERRL
jgi:hypothetical protein